ncbi:MAG: GEVED domain-containing protein [Bacteroidetes bacterium]|nr:GEVED domain-containing protein [Bacteroidota bacterium]
MPGRTSLWLSGNMWRTIITTGPPKVRIGLPQVLPADDAGVSALVSPVSGPGLTASEQVTVTIQNFGTNTLTSIPVVYKLNNNTPVSKTWTGSLSPGNTVNVTFTQLINLSSPGTNYTLKCWTTLAGDQEHSNDTLISSIANTSGVYCTAGASMCDEFISNVNMLGSNHQTSCSTGGYANYTSQQFSMSTGQTATLSIYNGPPVYTGDVCGVWVDWNNNAIFTDDPPITVTNGPSLFSATITVPQNVPSGPVRMRIRISYNEIPSPCDISEYGEVEDYTIQVTQVFSDDAGVYLVLKPPTGMDLSAINMVKARIRNYGNHSLTNLPITYRVNGATPVTETFAGPLLPGDSTDFTFSTPADLSIAGTYTIKVYSGVPGDVQHSNDTVTKQVTCYHFGNQLFTSGPVMNSPGSGFNGADESTVQLSIGLTSFGYYTRISSSFSVAEDFTVPAGETWNIDGLLFCSYQTGSTTTSPMTWVRFRIWDAPPPGGNLIFGDNTTNRLNHSFFSNIYRVYDTASGEHSRPLFYDYCTVSPTLQLNPGTYWVEWETMGNLMTGPFVPPLTISGQVTTGNARQRHDSIWINLVDGGSQTFQGLPLKVFGNNQPLDNATLSGTIKYLNTSL